jgi:hypothetical protein
LEKHDDATVSANLLRAFDYFGRDSPVRQTGRRVRYLPNRRMGYSPLDQINRDNVKNLQGYGRKFDISETPTAKSRPLWSMA